jgi:hypothetical protein
MATHGKAREVTINALSNLKPFKRSGFAMKGIEGAVDTLGRLSNDMRALYKADSDNIKYTVVSYSTPIAWVLNDDSVRIPDDKYSVATTQHQGMCKVYLNQ